MKTLLGCINTAFYEIGAACDEKSMVVFYFGTWIA